MRAVPSQAPGVRGKLRKLIIFIAIILFGLWLAIPFFMTDQIRRIATAGTGFTAERIASVHRPLRLGTDLIAPRLVMPGGAISLPGAVLTVSPLKPTTATLDLPDSARVELPGQSLDLGMSDPRAVLRIEPLNGFAPGAARISSGPLSVGDAPLAASLRVEAQLVTPQPDAPLGTQAAYELSAQAADIQPDTLARVLGLPEILPGFGPVALTGTGRIWLDRLPDVQALRSPPTPFPTGLRVDSADLRIGEIKARLTGRLDADENGYARGAMVLYTPDGHVFLSMLAESGLIPKMAAQLGGAMLRSLSNLPVKGYPEPPEGELRLPLTFANGQIMLGPVPLGAAPVLRPY